MALGTAAVLGAGFLSAAGGVYANAINSATQYKINQENMGLQYAINMDQIEAARMNNETAIELSNTAHQREVRDLRDANLNPILSANGSGSPVPSLDTPGLSSPTLNAPEITNPLSGITSAVQQAIAYDDQHKANEAKLQMLGLTGDKKADKEYLDLLRSQRVEEVQTARQELQTRRVQALTAEEKSQLEEYINRVEHTMLLDVYGGDTNDQIKGEIAELFREGILSDLKMRANRNLRENLSSARGISDAASNWFNWFKFSKRKK